MKRIALLLICFVITFTLSAQVDRTELESFDFSGVEFRNYEGPHQRIDTVAQIRGIGQLMANWDDDSVGRYFNKYRVLHLVDPDGQGRLDADIFILGSSAGVDHIVNLRRIVAAYLETAYDYSVEDAELLARFISYYNAVFRGQDSYFNEKYTALVLSSLDLAKAGLSTRYEDWPGKTEMLIPLTGKSGPAIETDALTDPEVIENLREQEGMGIEERKEITELKEEEIQAEEEAIEEERQALEEREEAVEEALEELMQQEEEMEQALEEGTITETEAEQQREEIAEEQEAIEEEKAAIEEEKAEIEEREEEQTERLEQIRDEREQIAQDELELQGGTATPETVVEPQGTPFITFSMDGNDRLGRLVLVDSSTGDTLKRSTLDNIRTPGFTPVSGGYLVIAGEDSGNRIISLVMLDEDDLTATVTADQRVSKDSGIFMEGSDIYAVVEVDGKWVPGRFNRNLEFTGYLNIEAAEYSFFGFNEGSILFQQKWGSIGTASLDDFQSP